MPHQDPHWNWGPPKCSSQGSPYLLVFKSLEATWARCTKGSGCCLTVTSSKFLSRVISKSGLGSYQLDQHFTRHNQRWHAIFIGAPSFYNHLWMNWLNVLRTIAALGAIWLCFTEGSVWSRNRNIVDFSQLWSCSNFHEYIKDSVNT